MAVGLAGVIQVGHRHVAALVRRTATGRSGRRRLSAWIAAQPLAILIAEGMETRALDIFGNPVSPDDVERLCPGAIADFERQARRKHATG